MKSGKVKFYQEAKKFGFITIDGSEKDIFFHISAYPQDEIPEKGQSVRFNTQEGKKGLMAVDIEVV